MAKATITGLIGYNKTEYEPFVVYYDPIVFFEILLISL